MPDSHQAERTVITHIGASASSRSTSGTGADDPPVPAPGRQAAVEIPAGLRDVTGEALADTARRELLEETGHVAREWRVLLDSYSSPGIITERMRIFLARGLEAADSGYQRQGEEKFLQTAWVPLAEAVAAALAGKLHNGATLQGVLAGYIASSEGFQGSEARTRPKASASPQEAVTFC